MWHGEEAAAPQEPSLDGSRFIALAWVRSNVIISLQSLIAL
jgi:hypothetical protein